MATSSALTFTGANGNLILVDTEFFQTAGTATLESRGIFLQRISSGAS